MKKIIQHLDSGLHGEITIPSDKSLSHRAVMLASLAKGKSVIKNFSLGNDPHSSLRIFQALGIEARFIDKSTLEINSSGNLLQPELPLDCGNSGTTMRLVSGILAGQNFNSELTGDMSLSKRPMKRIIEPLELMGAKISSVDNHAPLKIYGENLTGINYVSKLASAQVKSCILLAGLFAEGTTTYTEPYLSRNHTEIMLKYMGANIKNVNTSTSIEKSVLMPQTIEICGDISSAAYFIAAGLIIPNSDIIVKNSGLNPTRTGILEVVKKMGGDIQIFNERKLSGEAVGDIRITSSELTGCTIDGNMIPRLIDELPVIAVMATQAQGETVVKGAEDLRNKESDRIKSTVNELKKLGANIEERADGFIVQGKTRLKGDCIVDTYQDHRLAMCLYIAGLICEKSITINGFEWINISFPEFEKYISSLNLRKNQ